MTHAASGGTRSALRRARRRQRRNRVGALLAAGVLLAVLVTVYVATRDSPAPAAAPAAGPAGLLVQLTDAGGTVTGSAVLARPPGDAVGGALLVPSGLGVPGGTVGALSAAAAPAALQELLGARVGAGWRLDPATAARLVDAVGGVRVDVDVPVPAPDGTVLQPGLQPLGGAQAVAYATVRLPGEPGQAGAARLGRVLDSVLDGLPTSAGQAAGLLDTLGPLALAGTDEAGLAADLAGLATGARAGSLRTGVVPERPAVAGAAPQLDGPAARALREPVLPGSATG